MASHSINKMNTVSAKKFTAAHLKLTSIRKNKGNKNTAYLNNKEVSGRWYLRTPALRLPFGGQKKEYQPGQGFKCSLACSLDNITENKSGYNPLVAEFTKQLRLVDELLRENAVKNTIGFLNHRFKEDTDPETIYKRAVKCHHPMVNNGPLDKDTKEPKYNPLFKVKVYLSESGLPEAPARQKLKTGKYLNLNPEDVFDKLTPHVYVKLLLRPGPMWFKRSGQYNQFGLGWIVESIEIQPPILNTTSYFSKALNPGEFESDKLMVSPDKVNKYGAPQAMCSYSVEDKESRLCFNVPWGELMGDHRTNAGIERFQETTDKPYIRVLWDNHDEGVSDFINDIKSLIYKLEEVAKSRCESWFNDDEIGDMTPILRQRVSGEADEDEPYYMKFKLPYNDKDRKYYCTIKTLSGDILDKTDLDNIEKLVARGAKVQAVIRASPIYIMNHQTFGLPFEIKELIVDESTVIITNNTTIPQYFDEETDNEDEVSVATV